LGRENWSVARSELRVGARGRRRFVGDVEYGLVVEFGGHETNFESVDDPDGANGIDVSS
jgi:hypothetical protein